MHLTALYKERFRKTIYRKVGRAVGFRVDEITLPDGRKAQREFLTHPGAVGVLAFPSPNEIILIRQYRYPVGQFTYEIPAGKLGKGENPAACVRRELEEEAGYQAKRVQKLTQFWPTAAFSDEVIHLYFANDLKVTHSHPDDDEFLEVVKVSPVQMARMIRTGKIRDAKSIIAYLAWKTLFR